MHIAWNYLIAKYMNVTNSRHSLSLASNTPNPILTDRNNETRAKVAISNYQCSCRFQSGWAARWFLNLVYMGLKTYPSLLVSLSWFATRQKVCLGVLESTINKCMQLQLEEFRMSVTFRTDHLWIFTCQQMSIYLWNVTPLRQLQPVHALVLKRWWRHGMMAMLTVWTFLMLHLYSLLIISKKLHQQLPWVFQMCSFVAINFWITK